MPRSVSSRAVVLLLLLQCCCCCFSVVTAARRRLLSDEFRHRRLFTDNKTTVRVIVAYQNDDAKGTIQAEATRQGPGLAKLKAVSADVTLEQLLALENTTSILIEEDFIMHPWSDDGGGGGGGEIVPYGIDLIQARSALVPAPLSQNSSCRLSTSFKVAIIDTGLDVLHPDAPCRYPITDPNTNCMGASFDLASDEYWYAPAIGHGTHVAGTIGAIHNQLGVRGVMDDYGVCYIIARVFGQSGDTSLSSIVDAVQYVVDQGANVINLSLGGGGFSSIANQAYQAWQQQGILIVAAAGNDGDSGISIYGYPASYESVVSVAAVDELGERASYSNFNDAISVSAPGSAVLSLGLHDEGGIVFITTESNGYSGSVLESSVQPSSNGGITGELVLCDNLGDKVCPGPGDHICLIERGDITFEAKALNCEEGGGAAVIIYNNIVGSLAGSLSDPTSVTIPAVGVSQEYGQALLADHLGSTVSLTVETGYSYLDGTSMACPHVTGAAALLMRLCGECRNTDIVQCLQGTALDMGVTGKDDYYGYGIIQVDSAYVCLTNDIGCCERTTNSPTSPPPTSGPTHAPTITLSPSLRPSQARTISVNSGGSYGDSGTLGGGGNTTVIPGGLSAITGGSGSRESAGSQMLNAVHVFTAAMTGFFLIMMC